ncbi:MAG: VWA domain-containing protein [Planctomycetia bacterium]|nr:VWA domain-containing protein [Planctomycetia bacterium]
MARVSRQIRSHARQRRGASLILAALLVIVLLAMCGFAIDTGYIVLVRTELQRAADSGALAGAGAMNLGTVLASDAASDYAAFNSQSDSRFTRDQVRVEFGEWDRTTREFTPTLLQPTAIKVTVASRPQAFFFGRIFGYQEFTTDASAVATFQPRDIVLSLDYSGSMSFDSQIRSIPRLGRTSIEANLAQIHRELGSPRAGSMAVAPVAITTTSKASIKRTLGLDLVPYPFAGDSWDNYIDYVINDWTLSAQGYRKRYGIITWMNYLLSRRSSYAQTPDLWRTSQQPLTALKDATDVLLAELSLNSPDDQVGVSLYTSATSDAILEKALTKDYPSVSRAVRERQAGHYVGATNISAGLRIARLELQNNGRTGAKHIIVLMTDGQANLPGTSSRARTAVLDEARTCADAGIPVIAISLGVDADTTLMQQVADITGGAYFEVPGGRSVSEYEEQLKDVFRGIAADREVQLVQ